MGVDVSEYESQLSKLDYPKAKDDIISVNSPNYDGMPRSGKISDTTATKAVKLDKDLRREVIAYKRECARLKGIIREVYAEHAKVDNAVRKLPCQHQQIIRAIYQEKQSKIQVARKLFLSADHVRRREREAVDEIRVGIE